MYMHVPVLGTRKLSRNIKDNNFVLQKQQFPEERWDCHSLPNAFCQGIVLCVPALSLKLNENPVALVRKRTIQTERLPLVGEVSANFGG
jgi:hypothetical protein